MKTITVISLFLGLVLFAGCEETKKDSSLSRSVENQNVVQKKDSVAIKIFDTTPGVYWPAEEEKMGQYLENFMDPNYPLIDFEFNLFYQESGESKKARIPAMKFPYGNIPTLIYYDKEGVFGDLFVASYIPTFEQIHFNYYSFDILFKNNTQILTDCGLDSIKISKGRFAISIIEQEWWHSRNQITQECEFYSDIVSLKVAEEFYLTGRLVDLLGYINPNSISSEVHGDISGYKYTFQFEKYKSLLFQLGVEESELIVNDKFTSIEEKILSKALVKILKEHPTLLTDLKNLILERYG